jgi:predicted acylesterase/phospholipase RssA
MRALVLSGGGIDGLFAHGGALHALRRAYHRPVPQAFQRITGASAGALAAVLAAIKRDDVILEYAETIRPQDLFTSDRPFRAFTRANRLRDKAALLNPRGLRKIVKREIRDAWLSAIPPGQVVIPTCDLRRQRMVEWRPETVPPETFREALIGSMSIPMVFPAVRVVHANRVFELVDGGTTHNHPVELVLPDLWNARQVNEERVEIVVVSTLQPPEEADLPESGLARALAVIKRTAGLVMHELGNQRFDEAEDVRIPQRWIQVRTPDLDLEKFTHADAITAYQAGFEAVEQHYKRRPAR